MATPLTRPVPTPGDLAHAAPLARRAPLEGGSVTAPPFDRRAWERALSATDLPHYAARLLGWGLAHLAGDAGYLPPGTAAADRLGRVCRLTGKQVRMSLQQLQERRLISRPDIRTWQPHDLIRPITLTIPPVDGVCREEPPHTGEPR